VWKRHRTHSSCLPLIRSSPLPRVAPTKHPASQPYLAHRSRPLPPRSPLRPAAPSRLQAPHRAPWMRILLMEKTWVWKRHRADSSRRPPIRTPPLRKASPKHLGSQPYLAHRSRPLPPRSPLRPAAPSRLQAPHRAPWTRIPLREKTWAWKRHRADSSPLPRVAPTKHPGSQPYLAHPSIPQPPKTPLRLAAPSRLQAPHRAPWMRILLREKTWAWNRHRAHSSCRPPIRSSPLPRVAPTKHPGSQPYLAHRSRPQPPKTPLRLADPSRLQAPHPAPWTRISRREKTWVWKRHRAHSLCLPPIRTPPLQRPSPKHPASQPYLAHRSRPLPPRSPIRLAAPSGLQAPHPAPWTRISRREKTWVWKRHRAHSSCLPRVAPTKHPASQAHRAHPIRSQPPRSPIPLADPSHLQAPHRAPWMRILLREKTWVWKRH
jgi:hypothetical protein